MNLSFIWKAGKVLDADAGYCPAAREGDKCMNTSSFFKVQCEEKVCEVHRHTNWTLHAHDTDDKQRQTHMTGVTDSDRYYT